MSRRRKFTGLFYKYVSTSESPSSESCWISPHHTASEVHRHDGPHAGQVQETIGNDETERSTTVIVEVGLGTLVVGVLLVIGAQGGHTVEDVKGMPKPKPANAHRSATRCIGCIFVSAVGVASYIQVGSRITIAQCPQT